MRSKGAPVGTPSTRDGARVDLVLFGRTKAHDDWPGTRSRVGNSMDEYRSHLLERGARQPYVMGKCLAFGRGDRGFGQECRPHARKKRKVHGTTAAVGTKDEHGRDALPFDEGNRDRRQGIAGAAATGNNGNRSAVRGATVVAVMAVRGTGAFAPASLGHIGHCGAAAAGTATADSFFGLAILCPSRDMGKGDKLHEQHEQKLQRCQGDGGASIAHGGLARLQKQNDNSVVADIFNSSNDTGHGPIVKGLDSPWPGRLPPKPPQGKGKGKEQEVDHDDRGAGG